MSLWIGSRPWAGILAGITALSVVGLAGSPALAITPERLAVHEKIRDHLRTAAREQTELVRRLEGIESCFEEIMTTLTAVRGCYAKASLARESVDRAQAALGAVLRENVWGLYSSPSELKWRKEEISAIAERLNALRHHLLRIESALKPLLRTPAPMPAKRPSRSGQEIWVLPSGSAPWDQDVRRGKGLVHESENSGRDLALDLLRSREVGR